MNTTEEMITPAEMRSEIEKAGWRSVDGGGTFELGGVACFLPFKPIPRADFVSWIAGAERWIQQRQKEPAFWLR